MSAIGSVVGKYELLRQIAAGGMGEVYLARQRSSVVNFSALAAVKLLASHLVDNQAFVDMFLNEARVVGKLQHRNIVQVRDIDHDGTRFYMVMEYIPGRNLREYLSDVSITDRPLFSPRLGAEVFNDLAHALAAAHAAGLVHRDISPNNIMISDDGVAKLIDFGVARALSESSMTTPGTLKGKFGYMAPEYVRGEPYDHRADIFSLGVVMWETFARRRLFRGASAAEQLLSLIEGPLPKLHDVVEGFPTELSNVVAECLVRDPEFRIESAADLSARLEAASVDLKPEVDSSLRKWLDRRVAARIDERRRIDQALATIPAGNAIPDLGIAVLNSGASTSTFASSSQPGQSIAAMVLQAAAEPPANKSDPVTAELRSSMQHIAAGNTGTSIRLVNGQLAEQPAPTAHGEPPFYRRPFVFVGAMAVAVAVAIGWFVMRQSGGTAADSTPTPVAVTAQRKGTPAEIEALRLRGLALLNAGDRLAARNVLREATDLGGDGEVQALLSLAETGNNAPLVAPVLPAPPQSEPPRPMDAKPERVIRDVPKPPVHSAPSKPAITTNVVVTPPVVEVAPPTVKDVPVDAPLHIPMAFITVSTAERGARVIVDNVQIGVTPLVKYGVKAGAAHRVEVRRDALLLLAQTVQLDDGKVQVIVAPESAPVVAAPPPSVAPQVATTPKVKTARVTSDGTVAAGAGVVARCNACHATRNVGAVSARRYTQTQWERFFASGQHDRYEGLSLSAGDLMNARAFLRSRAADAAENQGAGIQEQ